MHHCVGVFQLRGLAPGELRTVRFSGRGQQRIDRLGGRLRHRMYCGSGHHRSAGKRAGRQSRISERDFDLVDGQAQPLADKQREDGIGAGADILRGRGHAGGTVIAELDTGGKREAFRDPRASRHSPSQRQPIAFHRAHARVAFLPAELLRSRR